MPRAVYARECTYACTIIAYARLTVKVLVYGRLKSRKDIYVRMCTRASARHEFSFHGWRDNPSLCHFSSVFLSHRLIELPGPGEIPVTYVLFSRCFFFYPGERGREETESSSSPRLFVALRRFRGYGYPLATPKLDFLVQLPVRRNVPVAK